MEKMNRREFVVNTSVAVSGLIGASALPLGIITPKPAFANDVKFVESSCGTNGKKILVAYQSHCGTTSEVAQSIGDIFCKHGAKVDVRNIDNIKTVTSYDAVVIGSAVKSSSWHSNAIEFIKENQNQLKHIPVVYYLTCLTLYFDTKRAQDTANSYFSPVLKAVPKVKPKEMQAFAGVLDYSKLNMMYKMVMRSKMKKKGIPEGDFRNFKKIEFWAENTAWPLLGMT
ncbi:MAG: flavodoxin domain-containing protein [Desulfobacteraceae bacterium]|nr:flavodoxin domain-containing protein [Desulfobacteraceae bacterium]